MSQTADFPFTIEDVVKLVGLKIRRSCTDGVYTDCPFCGDSRGKLKVSYDNNVWRCNYCNASGGMLQLYAKLRGVTTSQAYRDICDALQNGIILSRRELSLGEIKPRARIQESKRASSVILNATYSALLSELRLTDTHRQHLREVRGLSDAEIDRLGFKSTPPYYLCRSLTERLIRLGCTVEGVPGFYMRDGTWTVNFCSYTSGILLPARDFDGRTVGFQIRLDVPLRNDTGEKIGAKYVWLSSSGKLGGCSPGSPAHLIGDRNASTVYVTEGVLKADIAHCLTHRTFAAIAGANNLNSLDGLLRQLSANGTRLIIEAHDMDKYRNVMVEQGASEICKLARKYRMDCKRLTWNPNYKGIDDWQLALRRKAQIETVSGSQSEQIIQRFRIYQLDFNEEHKTHAFAFEGIEALHKAGYTQPPASEYRLIHDSTISCGVDSTADERLELIFRRYNDNFPADYRGRSISPSDVVELYSDGERRYYYRDRDSFCEVRFSPFLAKPMEQG